MAPWIAASPVLPPLIYNTNKGWQKADTLRAGMRSLSSYVSLVQRERERELLTYHIVTAANATGQQCDRVHIARVRPLIPHVFSHPSCFDTSHPTSLPSNEIWLYHPMELDFRRPLRVFATYSLHLPDTLPRLVFRKIKLAHVQNTREECLLNILEILRVFVRFNLNLLTKNYNRVL